jgi:hypothetical protein
MAKLSNVQQTKNKFIRDFIGLTKFDKEIIVNFLKKSSQNNVGLKTVGLIR